jgi:hypothetical protein
VLVKPALSTFSVVTAAAIALGLCATPRLATPVVAATSAPSPAAKSATKGACSSTTSKWAHLKCEQFNESAPGDEYFGRMKMSYLGIDNTYKDGAISAGAYTTDPHLIGKLDFATEALQRWAAKYPNDPELARSYYLGILVLEKVYTEHEQEVTWQFLTLLEKKYPNTYFGKTAKSMIAGGYTEHWFGIAQICPTPLPKGVMPQTTPGDTAMPSPAPGNPVVDVITPPCVQSSADATMASPNP